MQASCAIFSISKPDIQHQVGAQEMDLDRASMALLLHLFGVRYIFYIVLVQRVLQECSWLGFPELLRHQHTAHENPGCPEIQDLESAGQSQETADPSLPWGCICSAEMVPAGVQFTDQSDTGLGGT